MKNKLQNKLIVFDWNGTILADTLPALEASNICLEFFGRPPISLARFHETFDFPVIHFYTRNGCSVDEIIARQDESNILFQSNYERLAANTRTRSGARALLQTLNDAGAHCMVLSNYRTEKIAHHVHRLKLEPYFRHICANHCDGTSILHSTSKLERLQKYMDIHGFAPRDTVIIGDSLEEPDIAHKLGLTCISITGGVASESRLKRTKSTFRVHNLNDVLPILKEKL